MPRCADPLDPPSFTAGEPCPRSGTESVMRFGTIDNEIQFVQRAIQFYGPHYQDHLRTKGFSSEWFLHHWAAVTDVANRHGIGPRVLDLGCGPGWSSIFLAGRGCQVTAVDVAQDMLSLARENAGRLGLTIEFLEADMQAPGLPLDDRRYDTVLILDALHHCPDERSVLRNAFDALRPGGSILLVEPDWFHEYSRSSARARRDFGTTERGLGYGRLKRSLRASGFVDLRRFYCIYSTCAGGPLDRLKALATAVLTVTVGFPHRPTIVRAVRP
jgi:SAM-dependent methyltransferase